MTFDIALNYDVNAERETAMYEGGRERHLRSEQRATEADQLNIAGRKLVSEAMPKAVEALKQTLVNAPRQKPAYFPALEYLELDTLAMLVLSHVTRKAALATTAEPGRASLMSLYESLGFDVRQLVAEAAFKREDSKEYRSMMAKLPRSQQKRKEAALEVQKRFPVFGEESADNVSMAGGLVAIVMEATEMFSTFDHTDEGDAHATKCICFTADAAAFLAHTTEEIQYDNPEFQAMLVRPADWTSFHTGAYLDPRVARKNPLVNTTDKSAISAINAAIAGGADFVHALNATQAVPFQINPFVLEVVEYCNRKKIEIPDVMPGDTRVVPWESEDKKLIAETYAYNAGVHGKRNAIRRDIAEANRLKDEAEFFQPAYLDFRGRVYSRPGFNHQGSDYRKAMFNLANGEVLNEEGVWWLKWHVGTTGPGGVDKAPHADRVKWTEENLDLIKRVVSSPKRTVDLWKDADSPFCFLAAAEALVASLSDPQYVCRIPVAIDGSCSGLQHFSAILRDPEGGKHVNLVPNERPQDVYGAVAKLSAAVVEKDVGTEECGVIAELWLTFGINRSICKRNTMTYGYGSEAGGMSKQLWEDHLKGEKGKEHFSEDAKLRRTACMYLAKINFEAIKQTVPGAEACKTFFRAISKELASANLPTCWVSPTGFPVVSTYYEPTFKRVETMVWDSEMRVAKRFDPKVQTGFSKKVNRNEQKTGISPNFIHSMDAAHLHKVVLKSVSEGITDFLLIHDSFATTPNRMTRFSQIVRETFVEMYEQNQPLEDLLEGAKRALRLKAEVEDAEDAKDTMKLIANLEKLEVPARGDLDLRCVLKSDFCFA